MATKPVKKVARKAASKQVASRKPAAKKTVAKKRTARKVVAKKTPARKVVKKAAAKKTAVKKAAVKKVVAKNVVARKSPAKKAVAKKAARKTRSRAITRELALANTRALLEAKQEHERETPPWRALDSEHGQMPQPGFQSEQARAKAGELHAGESRMQAIQGSIGTTDRHNQGKRDSR